jgi:2-methylisocitrate lyase-like PEP mutase family enzyme
MSMNKMFKYAIIGFTLFCVAGCSDGLTAQRVLTEAGYKDIVTSGHSFFACGEHDINATGFTATGINGQKVSGAVCSGFFSGNHIVLF